MVGTFEKASLSVRVLKRDVSFKISDVKSVEKLSFRAFLIEFWEERGEKLMTCHLSLDNFCEISWPLGYFQRFGVFETDFCFKKTQISQFWYHEMFVFSESCLSQKTFYCRKLIVFSCLQFADCYIWSRILSCGVILCFNHSYGIFFFEKFPSKRHYHGVVENMCSFSKSYL